MFLFILDITQACIFNTVIILTSVDLRLKVNVSHVVLACLLVLPVLLCNFKYSQVDPGLI